MDKIYFLVIGSALVIILGIVSIFYIESGQPDSQINSMIDAVWWTVATVTTVGYGDIVPVTDSGRIVAIFYMFFGISAIAVSLSVLGTRFYKKNFENEKEISHGQKIIIEKMKDLEKNQEKFQKELRDLTDKLKDNLNKNSE